MEGERRTEKRRRGGGREEDIEEERRGGGREEDIEEERRWRKSMGQRASCMFHESGADDKAD